MLRVLFVTLISDMSRPTGYRTRVLSEMEAVRERGVSPHLVALSPAPLIVRPRAQAAFRRELRRRGLSGQLVPHLPSLGTRAGRLLMVRTASSVIAAATRLAGAQVVHAHGPYATAVALTAGGRSRTPVVYDAHGIATDEFALTGRAVGMSARRLEWEVRLVADLERRSWLTADGVVAVSHALIEHFETCFGPRQRARATRVPCAAPPSASVDPAVRAHVRSELCLGDRQVLVYVGSLAGYQMAPDMLDLVRRVRAVRPSVFLLVISQAPAERWHSLARAAGLGPDAYRVVQAVGPRVAELASAGDVGLMLRDDSTVNRVAFPTKLGEYLAAGVPVLATAAVRDPAELIERENVGLVARNMAEMTPSLVSGLLDEVCADRARWSERCRTVAGSELSWSHYAAVLANLYNTLPPR